MTERMHDPIERIRDLAAEDADLPERRRLVLARADCRKVTKSLDDRHAAYERAHQQANDALNEAAWLKHDLERQMDIARAETNRADVAEARDRALREALHEIDVTYLENNARFMAPDAIRAEAERACRIARVALDQQPANQPAQGERLDPHTLERAAQLADQRADYLTSQGANAARAIAAAIRNLRDGGWQRHGQHLRRHRTQRTER